MAAIKIIFFIIAAAMAVTLIVTTTTTDSIHHDNGPTHPSDQPLPVSPPKRVSRFLQQNKERNPRAADHCHKDHEVCNRIMPGRNATCCNNKCMDLGYDNDHCGACKNKCDFTEMCCGGECVSLAFDKRHCGACNNKCMPGGYCIYGMCDYA